MNNSEKVKVGVIGTGALGRHHVRLYNNSPQAELVGIHDCNEETAAAVAEENDTVVFRNQEDLVKQVEGVSVAIPTNRHYEVVKDVLAAGKNVLVEKPITDDVEQAQELVELAERQELVLNVGHVEQYNPVLSSLEKVEGAPRFIEAHRLAPYPPSRAGLKPRGTEVSVILDLMIHDLDVILSLLHTPVKKVDAVSVPILSDSADIANARVVFENNCVANLTASRVSTDTMRKIRVFKPRAYFSLDYGNRCGDIAYQENGTIKRRPVPIHNQNALEEELKEFCNCIMIKRKEGYIPDCRANGKKGLAALQLAQQVIEESKKSGIM